MGLDLKGMIASGDTEEAIKLLIAYASQQQNEDLENTAINLSSQFSGLEKQKKSFTITSSNATAKLAQINSILLSVAEDLEAEPVQNDVNDSEGIEMVDISNLEKEQALERLQLLIKRRKFFQDQFDISSDASQKFNLQENIDSMTNDINLLKEELENL